ncbi:MAG: hypothetical protein AB1489_30885 [Acidobacteriota bacterium]
MDFNITQDLSRYKFKLIEKEDAVKDEATFWEVTAVKKPIEILTANSNYMLRPAREPHCFYVMAGRRIGEKIAILGSCVFQGTELKLRRQQIVLGHRLVVLCEDGSRLVTSPILEVKCSTRYGQVLSNS